MTMLHLSYALRAMRNALPPKLKSELTTLDSEQNNHQVEPEVEGRSCEDNAQLKMELWHELTGKVNIAQP